MPGGGGPVNTGHPDARVGSDARTATSAAGPAGVAEGAVPAAALALPAPRGPHSPAMRVLVFFLDGVGLGAPDPATNPMAAAPLPVLESLLDGRRPLAGSAPFHGARASLVGVDATFGVPGTPQSGTGHAALL